MIHVIVGSETFGYKRRRIVDLAMSEYSNYPICGANMFSNIHHNETWHLCGNFHSEWSTKPPSQNSTRGTYSKKKPNQMNPGGLLKNMFLVLGDVWELVRPIHAANSWKSPTSPRNMLVMHSEASAFRCYFPLFFWTEAFRANGPLLEWAAVQETDPHRSQQDLIVVFVHVFCQCFELNLWMFVPRFGGCWSSFFLRKVVDPVWDSISLEHQMVPVSSLVDSYVFKGCRPST